VGVVCYSAPWQHVWARKPDGNDVWAGLTADNLTSSLVISDEGRVYFCCGTSVQVLQPPMALVPVKNSWPMFRANARHTGRVGS
jgi:hypothetical protein